MPDETESKPPEPGPLAPATGGPVPTPAEAIQAANAIAGAKIDEANAIAGEKIDEASAIAGEKIDEANAIAGEKIDEASAIAGEKIRTAPASGLTASKPAVASVAAGKPFLKAGGAGTKPEARGAGAGAGDAAGGAGGGNGGGDPPTPRPRPDNAELMQAKTQGLLNVILSLPALVAVFILLAMYFIFNQASDVTRVPNIEYSRGLITLLFSVGTILIAIMLTFSAIFSTDPKDTAADRFARAKEILSLLIGIFGTILGFYFGSFDTNGASKTATATVATLGGVVRGRTIYLDNSKVHDQDLSALKEFPALERLYLDNTDVTDAGLASLHDLKSLMWLSVRNTKVTTEGVTKLQQAIGTNVMKEYLLTVVADFPTPPLKAAPTPPAAKGEAPAK